MYSARPPSQLILEGGPARHADAWRQWYAQFTLFLKSSGINRGGSDVKSSLLLELIGPKGYDIFSAFIFEEDGDSQDFDKLVKKLNEYFTPKQTSTLARYNFFTRSQEKEESLDDYLAALRSLAQKCQFDNLEEGLLRDRLVCGIWRNDTRKALLETEDLTLKKAVEICRDIEMPREEKQQIEEKAIVEEGSEVKEVNSRSKSHLHALIYCLLLIAGQLYKWDRRSLNP